MAFDPTDPSDVKAAAAYFQRVEAEELELDRALVARSLSGVDGLPLSIDGVLHAYDLPDLRPEHMQQRGR